MQHEIIIAMLIIFQRIDTSTKRWGVVGKEQKEVLPSTPLSPAPVLQMLQ